MYTTCAFESLHHIFLMILKRHPNFRRWGLDLNHQKNRWSRQNTKWQIIRLLRIYLFLNVEREELHKQSFGKSKNLREENTSFIPSKLVFFICLGRSHYDCCFIIRKTHQFISVNLKNCSHASSCLMLLEKEILNLDYYWYYFWMRWGCKCSMNRADLLKRIMLVAW